MQYLTDNTRITGLLEVSPPNDVISEFPITPPVSELVFKSRQNISDIIHGRDDRLVVVVGPCSIHDPKAAIEYAKKLKNLESSLSSELKIVMRVYFEKPRTTVGWKGLINDPNLDDSYDVNKGLREARKILLNINEIGLPAATEYLDIITPQYISDLISWGAIGARTTESQVHRELASGLSCPVGFKNSTNGSIQVAIDAIGSASQPHIFLSITKEGKSAIFNSSGNKDCHVILRGGKIPNFESKFIKETSSILAKSGNSTSLMVDMSHGNSQKQFKKQLLVNKDIADQIASGERSIFGVMIESHLVEGNQSIGPKESLTYGQSITDACVSWEDTEVMLKLLSSAVKSRRKNLEETA
ncbi:MAG: 3-deoxy-7-phosphoheptulonate synthase [Gammaproteobacteria bacterium]|jgi:3-deoxy-7-phosphoheptulonate synthase